MKRLLPQVLGMLLIACPIIAQGVPESQYQQIYDLVSTGRGSFFQHYYFVGQRNLKIVFTKFGNARGSKGSLVISPGRTESSLKYTETAYDFIQAGYSPVYVINHRGQGLSERSLPDSQKGHVDDYRDYTSDFQRFMEFVLMDKKVDVNRLYAIAHSMGGGIITDYSMSYRSPFKAVVLGAPLFKIPNQNEDTILRDTFLACYIQFKCNSYIPNGGPFRWEDRDFEKNDVTHSRVRFAYRDHLWHKWPTWQLGSPTIRWVRETTQANIKRRDIKRLGMITTPTLILQAEQESVVDNAGHPPICQRMGRPCRIERIPGARHEMLMESDAIRTPVIHRMLRFFSEN